MCLHRSYLIVIPILPRIYIFNFSKFSDISNYESHPWRYGHFYVVQPASNIIQKQHRILTHSKTMPNALHALAIEAQDFYSKPASERDDKTILQLLSCIQPEMLCFKKLAGRAQYYSIYESALYTMCIFRLPKGTVLPLHDHPFQTVFSSVISGKLHVKSYALLGMW